jgi:hypothetical protein
VQFQEVHQLRGWILLLMLLLLLKMLLKTPPPWRMIQQLAWRKIAKQVNYFD